jgi:hypothetical protein
MGSGEPDLLTRDILSRGGPGRLVGIDAAMRPLRSSPPLVCPPGETARDSGSDLLRAEAELGGTHPLVGLLGRIEEVTAQLVALTALQGAGIVFASGGADFGLAVAAGSAVGQIVCGCRVWAFRARRRELCLELIVAGREALPLACVQREVSRLRERRTLLQLAGSLEEMLATATRPLDRDPRNLPFFDVRVIRKVAMELQDVASQLRDAAPGVRGVAEVELLLTSAGTPLYGAEVEPLRQELGRARYLLGFRV